MSVKSSPRRAATTARFRTLRPSTRVSTYSRVYLPPPVEELRQLISILLTRLKSSRSTTPLFDSLSTFSFRATQPRAFLGLSNYSHEAAVARCPRPPNLLSRPDEHSGAAASRRCNNCGKKCLGSFTRRPKAFPKAETGLGQIEQQSEGKYLVLGVTIENNPMLQSYAALLPIPAVCSVSPRRFRFRLRATGSLVRRQRQEFSRASGSGVACPEAPVTHPPLLCFPGRSSAGSVAPLQEQRPGLPTERRPRAYEMRGAMRFKDGEQEKRSLTRGWRFAPTLPAK